MRPELSESHTVDTLRRDGIASWDSLSREQVADIDIYLGDTPVRNAHVAAKATSPEIPLSDALYARKWPAFSHRMEDVISAPHFFEKAVALLPLVREYFETPEPVLYSFNVFWTQPASVEYLSTHFWHRDFDDEKQLVLFLYGTDVLHEDDGAHKYQRGTHLTNDETLGRDWKQEPPQNVVKRIFGPAGTMFLADTNGLHMGYRPRQRRMLAWARWGVSDLPRTYVRDELRPAPRSVLGERYPTDPYVQKAIRLVVR